MGLKYYNTQIVKLGPAGISCRCCNPWFNYRKHGKPAMHRVIRHNTKQRDNAMAKVVEEAE
jgi:hypothetical protein